MEQNSQEHILKREQSLQTEKMAFLGHLASSIAHEVNNPLSYIYNNLDILSKYLEKLENFIQKCGHSTLIIETGKIAQRRAFIRELQNFKEAVKLGFILDDFKEILNETNCGIESIHHLVSNLKLLSHSHEDTPIHANLNNIIDGIFIALWVEVQNVAEIIKEYGDIPEIRCQPQQLGQAFINLLISAARTIDGNGKIIIKTNKKGNNVCAEITTYIVDMQKEIQEKPFKSFFDTKGSERDIEYGLKIADNIIKKHSGSINVSRNAGRGITITAYLPV